MSIPQSVTGLSSRIVSRQAFSLLRPAPRSLFHIHVNTKPSHHPHQSRIHLFLRHGRQNAFFTTSKPPLHSRFSSSFTRQPPAPNSSSRFKLRSVFLPSLTILAGLAYFFEPKTDPLLNQDTFTPFTITAREQVSPTAFILTVRPSDSINKWDEDSVLAQVSNFGIAKGFFISGPQKAAVKSQTLFDSIWDAGATWSVEVKHPLLQVARDYTPLPNLKTTAGGEVVEGEVRPELSFLIRRTDGGEVSGYLSGLSVGKTVELRGPHLGFDVRRRLGDAERVVVLAGGTGIAPALQVVRAVLQGSGSGAAIEDGKGPRVDIIWANRQRTDCRTCPCLRSASGEVVRGEGQRGRIMEQVAHMQDIYPGRLSVRCTVDEERSFIDEKTVAGLVITETGARHVGEVAKGCWLHRQETMAWRPATDVDAAKKTTEQGEEEKESSCGCAVPRGNNLLFVSGPQGFIEHFAGPTRWANGMELQGPVGGVLGRLRARYPDAMKGWLVLKL